MDQTSAVVDKRKAACDGIKLEHCRLRAGELPAHRHREHVPQKAPKSRLKSVARTVKTSKKLEDGWSRSASHYTFNVTTN